MGNITNVAYSRQQAMEHEDHGVALSLLTAGTRLEVAFGVRLPRVQSSSGEFPRP